MDKNCLYCGENFTTTREKTRFCSLKCVNNRKKKQLGLVPIEPKRPNDKQHSYIGILLTICVSLVMTVSATMWIFSILTK